MFTIPEHRRHGGWIAALFGILLLLSLATCTVSSPNPIDWLRTRPFVPAPDWTPLVAGEDLPEGFNMVGPTPYSEETPDGYTVRGVGVVYQRPVGGQVSDLDEVEVVVFGFSEQAGRDAYLATFPEDLGWEFVKVGGQRIVRGYDSSTDVRTWIAGPYLIMIRSGRDSSVADRNPRVDLFAERYLKLYPPKAELVLPSPTPNPLDWLQARPFIPAPDWMPLVVGEDLPEGFKMVESAPYSEETPEGYTFHGAEAVYERSAGDQASVPDRVEVYILGFSDQTGRDTLLDTWFTGAEVGSVIEFFEVGGQRIILCSSSSSDVRMWISGPYLIMVSSGRDPSITGRNPWVDRFTELYLGPYPPKAELALPSPTPRFNPILGLLEAPFVPVPEGMPALVTSNLPEGFIMLEPEFGDGETPEGYAMRGVSVAYQRPEGGQVALPKDQVGVQIVGFPEQAGRDAYLNAVPMGDFVWELVEMGGQRIVSFYSSASDGRIWVSGPYVIVIGSGLDPTTGERNPWVDRFAELYLELYPSR